jgi:hypothetical protein
MLIASVVPEAFLVQLRSLYLSHSRYSFNSVDSSIVTDTLINLLLELSILQSMTAKNVHITSIPPISFEFCHLFINFPLGHAVIAIVDGRASVNVTSFHTA